MTVSTSLERAEELLATAGLEGLAECVRVPGHCYFQMCPAHKAMSWLRDHPKELLAGYVSAVKALNKLLRPDQFDRFQAVCGADDAIAEFDKLFPSGKRCAYKKGQCQCELDAHRTGDHYCEHDALLT